MNASSVPTFGSLSQSVMMNAHSSLSVDLEEILKSKQPAIDLKLDQYKTSTTAFLNAVTKFTNKAMEEIMSRKSNHIQEMRRVAERQKEVEVETLECKVREIKLMEDLEREQNERKDSESSLTELKRQHAAMKEKIASINAELEQCLAEIGNLRRERNKDLSTLEKNASRIHPELAFTQDMLKMTIDGIDADKLLFCFTHIDPDDWSQQFSFVLDVSNHNYKVTLCTPPLQSLPTLLQKLNETRDIFTFIKQVRSAFADIVEGGRSA